MLSLVLFIGCYTSYAQQNGYPLPKANGESNEKVSLYTGRVSFNLPLASAAGRGDMAISIGATNDGQAKWGVFEYSRYHNPITGDLESISYAARGFNPSTIYNSTDYTPLSLSLETSNFSGLSSNASGPMSSYLLLTANDGSKVYFRDTVRDGEPTELNATAANGPVVQCSVQYGIVWIPGSPPPPPPPSPPAHCLRGKVFHSTDGSAMTFVFDHDVYDAHYPTPNDPFGTVNYFAFIEGSNYPGGGLNGYLHMRDGSKQRIEGGKASWIVDRNGNKTTLQYATTTFEGQACDTTGSRLACRLIKITDPLNREIDIDYGAAVDEAFVNTVTRKGFGGANRQIKIYYKRMGNAMYAGQELKEPAELFPIPTVSVPPNGASSAANLGAYRKSPEDPGQLNPSLPYNPLVITHIVLPNEQQYQFKYNSVGEIARITSPGGAYTDYLYGPLPDPRVCATLVQTKRTESNGLTWVKYPWFPYEVPDAIVRRVTESQGFDANGNLQVKNLYSDIGVERPVMVTTKDSNNNTVTAAKHYYDNGPCEDYYKFGAAKLFFDDWKLNREYKIEVFANENAASPLRTTESFWEQRAPIAWLANHPLADAENATNDPRVTEIKTTLETGQIAKKTFSYDQYNNSTDTNEYDYGGQFIRRSHIEYVTDSTYTDHTGSHLRSLPLQTWISSDLGGSNKVSFTQFEYDTYAVNSTHALLVPRTSVTGHDTVNFGTGFTKRGDITASTSYANAAAQTGGITSYSHYDILGNIVKTIDAKGNSSTISYNDNFGVPDNEAVSNSPPSQLSGLSTYAFSTSATNPLGWTGYTQLDYHTGAAVNTQDLNGIISKTIYNDSLDRPTQSVTAINILEKQTTIDYDDVNHQVQVTSDLKTYNDNLVKSITFFDELGRTKEIRSYEEDGDYKTVQTEYNALGMPYRKSNPFRPTEIDATHPILWTETRFDALGRIKEQETPDGAKVLSAYDGNRTLITDQAGKKRISKTNAVGQLTDVWEVTASDPATVSVTFPGSNGTGISHGYQTTYSYDTLGNLAVTSQAIPGQSTQTRTFTYNSLSKLLSASNPESGTVSYLYDNNGNVTQKSQPRSGSVTVATAYTYDALNRLTQKSYSGESGYTTPTVTYTYDAVLNAKGLLNKVVTGSLSSPFSVTDYQAFDRLGKVTQSQQTTDGTAYNPMTYTYNLSGALIEEKYPSGRVVKNVLDDSGAVTAVQSKKNAAGGYWNYADSFTYGATGIVSSMQLGNGRWESTQINSRLQPTRIALGTTQNTTNILKLDYSYGTTTNNGNMQSQSITVPAVGSSQGFTAVQNYSYDSQNRMKQADEKPLNYLQADCTAHPEKCWQQTFTYDRYGNRRFDPVNTTTLESGCTTVICNPEVSTTNNRLVGYTFDSAGNTTKDAENRRFTYDGENKQVKVETLDSNGTVIGTVGDYFYDGAGKRVKKVVPNGETTVFVYDASGKLVAEYSTVLSLTPQVSYLTDDHLGSPRISTNQNGTVLARHDYHPFGEEIYNIGGRISALGYTSDEVRQKFTGYERDQETDLDFAQARYFNYGFGRFSSPDPLAASAITVNPQSWNRYTYAYNCPLRFTDPSGMSPGDFYDENEVYLGWDGTRDDKIYLVTDKKEKQTIRDAEKKGGSTPLRLVLSAIEFPSLAIRQATATLVANTVAPTATDLEGNHHEESMIAGTDENGNEVISPGIPGGFADLSDLTVTTATSDPFSGPNTPRITNATFIIHSHPGGVWNPTPMINKTSSEQKTTVGGGAPKISSRKYEQSPVESPTDLPVARRQETAGVFPNALRAVAGVGDNKLYIYNGTRLRATFPLDKFTSITVRQH